MLMICSLSMHTENLLALLMTTNCIYDFPAFDVDDAISNLNRDL